LKTFASSGVVVDYQTGQILFEKGAFDKIAPSSVAVLMTLYVAYEQGIDEDTKFRVSKEAVSGLDGMPVIHLKEGQKVRFGELLEGIAITYAADACKVVAENIAGSQEAFVQLMNETAKKLGMHYSVFTNSYGKDEKGQEMSAYDVGLLFSKIIQKYPEFYKSFNKRFFDFTGISEEEKRKNTASFWNKNKLIWDMKGADGGVTGYNRSSGYSIVASAHRDNKRLIAVLYGMKLQGSRDDVNTARAREVRHVLELLYDEYEIKTFFGKDKMVAKIDLLYGKADTVAIYPEEDIYFVYPNGEEHNVVLNISYFDRVVAPLKKGQVVGNVDMVVDGVKVDSYKLIIANDVRAIRIGPARFYENLKQLILGIIG
jgi:D-alanyl-D-alanine carboxypeptidase (penicillin-binding protein 5/6)